MPDKNFVCHKEMQTIVETEIDIGVAWYTLWKKIQNMHMQMKHGWLLKYIITIWNEHKKQTKSTNQLRHWLWNVPQMSTCARVEWRFVRVVVAKPCYTNHRHKRRTFYCMSRKYLKEKIKNVHSMVLRRSYLETRVNDCSIFDTIVSPSPLRRPQYDTM